MINVHISIAQESNPGWSAAAAVFEEDGERVVRSLLSSRQVTNFHATWAAVWCALEALNGRPGVIWTCLAGLSGALSRPVGDYGGTYDALKIKVARRLRDTGSRVVFKHKRDMPNMHHAACEEAQRVLRDGLARRAA